MNHLTDETLNEYLDGELPDRAPVEAHLTVCVDCAARLAALEALFAELDFLPETELTHSLAARFIPSPSLPAALPRWLTLTVTLQAALAVTAVIALAPFVAGFVSPYLGMVTMPSLTEMSAQAQSQWVTWLDLISTFQFPRMPQFPPLEIPSLMLMSVLAGVSLLWLVGNGLLLRRQTK